MLWLPVRKRMATLREVCEDWALDDVAAAHMVDTVQQLADARAELEARSARGSR